MPLFARDHRSRPFKYASDGEPPRLVVPASRSNPKAAAPFSMLACRLTPTSISSFYPSLRVWRCRISRFSESLPPTPFGITTVCLR